MAESGSRAPAGTVSAASNLKKILDDPDYVAVSPARGREITSKLRNELRAKGLQGFKKGGKVKKTGVYKLHKGEKVLTAKQTKHVATKKAVQAVQKHEGAQHKGQKKTAARKLAGRRI